MRPYTGTRRALAMAAWASCVREWREFGRQKLFYVSTLLALALLLTTRLLAERAFGSEGFEANGGGSNFVGYVALGWLALQIAQQGLYSGQGYLRWASQAGVLPHVWATPCPRWIPIVGVTGWEIAQWTVMLGVLAVALLFLPGAAPAGFDPLVIPVFALALIAFWGLGIAFAGVGLAQRQPALASIFVVLIFTMAGSTFPVAMLPWEVRWVSLALPYTYVIDAMRHTLLGTPTIVPLAVELGVLAASAIGGVLGGIWIFNRVANRATRRGLIGLFT
ncbi:MAG: ABC transporter permease [Chloroflexi bacterium]|nr:ABC transporter permease [Chloroflexota bacterium]